MISKTNLLALLIVVLSLTVSLDAKSIRLQYLAKSGRPAATLDRYRALDKSSVQYEDDPMMAVASVAQQSQANNHGGDSQPMTEIQYVAYEHQMVPEYAQQQSSQQQQQQQQAGGDQAEPRGEYPGEIIYVGQNGEALQPPSSQATSQAAQKQQTTTDETGKSMSSVVSSLTENSGIPATILTEVPVKDMPNEVLEKLKRDYGVRVVATRERPGANLVINCDDQSNQENSICRNEAQQKNQDTTDIADQQQPARNANMVYATVPQTSMTSANRPTATAGYQGEPGIAMVSDENVAYSPDTQYNPAHNAGHEDTPTSTIYLTSPNEDGENIMAPQYYHHHHQQEQEHQQQDQYQQPQQHQQHNYRYAEIVEMPHIPAGAAHADQPEEAQSHSYESESNSNSEPQQHQQQGHMQQHHYGPRVATMIESHNTESATDSMVPAQYNAADGGQNETSNNQAYPRQTSQINYNRQQQTENQEPPPTTVAVSGQQRDNVHAENNQAYDKQQNRANEASKHVQPCDHGGNYHSQMGNH